MMIPAHNVDVLVTWVAALSTLAILSVVYRENPLYRLFEHLFIGVSTGFGVYIAWRDVLAHNWWEPLTQGQWFWVLPPLVALLFYTVYIPKYAWLSRLVITGMLGLGAGLAFRGFATQVFPQVTASFLPVIWGRNEVTWTQALNNLVFLVTLISVMAYFFFSFRHDKPLVHGTARLGRWLLMIAFGATFGSTVMARFSLLIDRLDFLLVDWLHLAR